MKKSTLIYIVSAVGIILLAAGLYMMNAFTGLQGIMNTLPYVCIGLGCGISGYSIGNIIMRSTMKNNPEIVKQIEIDKNDERSVAIGNRAKARAFDMMIFVFGALLLSFALIGVKMIAVLLLVAAYLFVIGCAIYYRCKYEKEM